MSNWEQDVEGLCKRRKYIDKNRFCKKNKLGGGRYGSHLYDKGYCRMCGKIDPSTKKNHFNQEKEYVEQPIRDGR